MKGETEFIVIGIFLVGFLILMALNPNPSGYLAYTPPQPEVIPADATPLYDCGNILSANTYYYLNNSISYYPGGTYFGAGCWYMPMNATINCNGHTIDGMGVLEYATFSYESDYDYTFVNCIFQNFTANVLSMESMEKLVFKNNVVYNTPVCLGAGYWGGNIDIENNVFGCASYGIVFPGNAENIPPGSSIIKNNWFKPMSYSIYWVDGNPNTWHDYIYNNRFDGGNNTIYNPYPAINNTWNLNKVDIPGRIIGFGKVGGNYWGSCIDLDCDGFCDNPIVAGNTGNLDYAGLSTGC